MNGVANAALGAVIIIKVEAANTLPLFMGPPDLWMGTQNYISTHIFSVNRVSTKMAELSWVLGIQKPAFGGFPNPTPSLELRNVVIRVHHLR